jgi:RNA polymerase sigma-70 factor (ECF subfamily)
MADDLQALDDTGLMLRVRDDGGREAFAELVRRHQRRLLNFFLRSGVYDDAEDLVQQTFLRLYRYRDRYRPTARFTTFLYLLARQVWIDDLRRRGRMQRLRLAVAEETGPEPQAAETAPAAAVEGHEAARALERLPESARAVVVLGILQGLAYRDVAATLGVPVGTVKSRMYHALRALRRMLEGEEP